MRKTALQFNQLPKDYAGLCQVLPPRPIRDSVDLKNVSEVADVMAGHDLNPDQEDYFDLLCRFIAEYEREHLPQRRKVSGLEALRHIRVRQRW